MKTLIHRLFQTTFSCPYDRQTDRQTMNAKIEHVSFLNDITYSRANKIKPFRHFH